MRQQTGMKKLLCRFWSTVPGSYVASAIAYSVLPLILGYDTLERTCEYAKSGWKDGCRIARHELGQMKEWAKPNQIRANNRDRLGRK